MQVRYEKNIVRLSRRLITLVKKVEKSFDISKKINILTLVNKTTAFH